MLNTEFVKINSLALHNVGNKSNEDPINFSQSCTELNEALENNLSHYFLSHFKPDEQYHFFHDVDLELNETYSYVSKIFENPNTLLEQSKNLAKHLYNQSNHPKIKEGEFYVAYFKDCIIKGETLDAIGLFKSENKNTFLEVAHVYDAYEIVSKEGIDINKLDKGCLIFNTNKEDGYILSIVDNTNRSSEAQYWVDDFLGLRQIKNEYHQTNEFLGIAKHFVTEQLKEEFEVTKTDQIDLLNRSVDYFKSHETFEKQEFEEEVFEDQNIIESFNKFDNSYRNDNDVELSNSFEISSQAVKKQARAFKSVLKLDKNFHIYIHGDKNKIEHGIETDGRKFYKIYYDKEI